MRNGGSAKKPKVATGIEFGDSFVRVATVALRGGKVVIRALSQAMVRPGRPGVREDLRAARKSALKEALSRHPRDLGSVIVGIPREDVVARIVSLPSTDEQEVREMLAFDVERYLPFPQEEAEVSHRILEQVGDTESRVLMVAARRDDLYAILDDLHEVGIHPDRIDVDAHGCGYGFARNGMIEEESAAIVHLDHHDSFAGLIVGGQLRFSRSLGIGFDDFHLDDSDEDSAWTIFIKNLKRTLAGFSHEEFGIPPKILILGGPGSEIPELVERFEKTFQIPVTVLRPFDEGKVSEPVSEFGTAVGLALEETEQDYGINLIPAEIEEMQQQARRKRFLVNAAMLTLINLALLAGIVGHAFWNKQQILRMVNAEIRKIDPHIKDVEEIAEKLEVIDANIDREYTAFRVLQELFTITPDRIRFEQISFKKSDNVTMSFETFEYRDTNDFKSILSKSPCFAGTIEGGNQTTQKWNPKQWKFRQTIKVRGLQVFLRSNPRFAED